MKTINLVFLGEKQTGKTALLNRFLTDTPEEKFNMEVDPVEKTLTLHNPNVEIHLIDSSGMELCKRAIENYIHYSTVFIVVYDVTELNTFTSVPKWVDLVRSEHGENAIIMIVGNKSELGHKRVVTQREGEQMSKDLDAFMFIETSAVSGPHVRILFQSIVGAVSKLGVTFPKEFHHHGGHGPEHEHEQCSIT